VFSDLPLRPTRVPRRVKSVCEAESETERREKGVPSTSKRASDHVSYASREQYLVIPGSLPSTDEASTRVCGSRAGSVEEVVALMLMHRAAIGFGRAVAAAVRCAKPFQGETAGRIVAVPVNWRAFEC
jgi:hypothetical protein